MWGCGGYAGAAAWALETGRREGVWRVFTPGPATFGGRSLLWGLAVSRAFGDLLMKERLRV